jgi:glycosyltransferase involved in cell wall biosynthesis
LYAKAIDRSDAITTPSHYLKNELGLDKAIVIPNAINADRYQLVEHKEKNQINIITVSSLYFKEKAQGLISLLLLISRLPYIQNHRILFTVVGRGPYLQTVKEYSKTLNIHVAFKDNVINPKSLLENSDIFIYYSFRDNFPNAILEAMACGLPVITNDIGAVNEMITHRRDGVVATDDSYFTSELISLIGNANLRNKIGANARRTVEEKFNWKLIVDRYIKIYDMLYV